MYYVYVLQTEIDEKFYIGYSADLRKRFKRHQKGEVISTASRKPFRLIFYEAFKDRKDAKRREKHFKTTKGKSSLRQIIRNSIL